MQNIDGRLILTAEVAKNKMAKTINIKLPRGLNGKSVKNFKHKNLLTNKRVRR